MPGVVLSLGGIENKCLTWASVSLPCCHVHITLTWFCFLHHRAGEKVQCYWQKTKNVFLLILGRERSWGIPRYFEIRNCLYCPLYSRMFWKASILFYLKNARYSKTMKRLASNSLKNVRWLHTVKIMRFI